MNELNALFAIAYRDFMKFYRNKARVLLHVGFPIILVWVIGSGFQFNTPADFPYDYRLFIFAGVVGYNAFNFVAVEIISFIEERKTGFSQTLFVAPISRFTIVAGKILGEMMAALVQFFVLAIFGVFIGLVFNVNEYLLMILITLISGFLGGAFGLLALSNVSDIKTASQIAPLLLGPQFFLAGVLQPIASLPGPLFILSRLMPLTYVVDFSRGAIFIGEEEFAVVVIHEVWYSFLIICILSLVFFYFGTYRFIRAEKNR